MLSIRSLCVGRRSMLMRGDPTTCRVRGAQQVYLETPKPHNNLDYPL